MDPAKILRDLLGNNATRSRGIETRQRRGGEQSPKAMAESIEDLLGVGDDRRAPVEAYEPPPQPRRRQPNPSIKPQARESGPSSGGLGGLLGEIFGRATKPPTPQPRQERPRPDRASQDQAVYLIRAMCNAAKVDGDIDKAEQEAILSRLGDVTQDEIDFVRKELATPLDLTAFCRSVPATIASDVYGFSVMAIQLDTLREAAYLGRLAEGLDLDIRICNQLHEKFEAPVIFA